MITTTLTDRFQGIPIGGYNVLMDGLLKGIPVKCGVDYLAERGTYRPMADKVVYTGSWTRISIMSTDRWSTGACVSRRNVWTWKTIRGSR